jgi:hypothetical protein
MNAQVLEGQLLTHDNDGMDEQQAYKFEEFRSSAAGQEAGLMVNVYRAPANPDGTAVANGKLQYMFQMPVDQLTREQILDKVAREYMATQDPKATFWFVRIHIRKPGARGILFNELCTVLPQPVMPGAESHAPPANDGGVLATVAKMLTEAQARTDALIARLLENRAPTVDPIQIFLSGQKQSAEMFKELAVAMRGSAPAAGAPGTTSSLDDTLKSMLVFKQIKDFMGGEFMATPAGENATAEILKAVGPIAKPFFELMVENMRAKKQPALPNPAAPAGSPSAPSTTKPAEAAKPAEAPKTESTVKEAAKEPTKNMQREDAMLFAMRDQLGQLADAIAMNPDPAAVGTTILENLPETYDEPLFTLLSGEDWFDRMSAVQNKLRPHREWMNKLRDYIIASFTEEDDDAANDEKT